MKNVIRANVAASLATIFIGHAASAGTFESVRSNGNLSVVTIIEFGAQVQPITITESSKVNIARVIEIGGAGPVDATIIQNGVRNTVDVFQMGSSTTAIVGQSGLSNTADIVQFGGVTNSLLLQIGNMNTGSVRQSGRVNSSSIFQFGR